MTNPFTLTKEQYQELYQEVLLFAKIGGVVNDEEGIWKMCHEEFVNELLPAIEAQDRIKVIDGVCDSWVTIVQLHHYYMSKPTWELPEPETTYLHDLYELEEMIQYKSPGLVHNSLQQLVSVSEKLAKEYNFNLFAGLVEVNRSNMTKFPYLTTIQNKYKRKTVEKNLISAAYECEELSNGKYKNVVANVSKHSKYSFVVFREDFGTGKICKPLWHFEEPDFTHCLLENA